VEFTEAVSVAGSRVPSAAAEAVSAALDVQEKHERARAYLRARGLTQAEADADAVCLAGYREYVVFPVREDGEVVTWHARYCWGDDHLLAVNGAARAERMRWISPPTGGALASGFASTKDVVWTPEGFSGGPTLYVCEGIFDAYFFAPHGLATMGVGMTTAQGVKVLDFSPKSVMVVLDADRETVDLRPFRRLAPRAVEFGILRPPEGVKDFGDLVARGERSELF
jgi:hypothetical protein